METKEIKITPPPIEEWKNIDGYNGLYQISSKGRVRSLDRIVKSGLRHNKKVKRSGKIIKPIPHHNGYLFVTLSKNNITNCFSIHKLVANAFIENPYNKPYIDHINTITSDNRVENLRWCTASENSLNPITKNRRIECNLGKRNPMFGKRHSLESRIKNGKCVLQFSKDGSFIKEFPTISFAAQEVNVHTTNIITACKNFNKTSGGYRWKYKTMN